ncbi:MAG: 1-acyl-sn-glycerol-3-phosphate acyltransferase [Flavobacteriia bacterium]|nr:1-acyl-sn-glycerol-3-phosphate acyltransferase [Flavobacteriia bacterium]
MSEKKRQQIDVEEVIKQKNPKLLKVLPRFVINYIKKIIHQREMNQLLDETEFDFELDFIRKALIHFQFNIESKGLENIPEKGSCIIVCNHPLGGLDGIAVMNEVGKVRSDMKALVNDILMNLKNLSTLLIPINKQGKNTIENSKRINNAYLSDECLILFPAGLVSRKQKGCVKDLEWQKSFITKAIKFKQDIIPVFVDAQNSKFFYNLALLRKKIGLKVNLEMFFLVDEVYKQKGKTIRITFGKPISFTQFSTEKTHLEWAEEMKKHVYTLAINSEKVW